MLLFAIATSQAQDISVDALKDGVLDEAEIKKELILNGYTKVTKDSDSSQDTYAYNYDEDTEKAAVWVTIYPMYSGGGYLISLQIIRGIFINLYEELLEEISDKCKFKGIGLDDEIEYTCGDAEFSVSSRDGVDFIRVYPSSDPIPEEQEHIERERQDQAERLNSMGRDAFGNQGVGETEGSEGITQGGGNQGDPIGSPEADNYGTGGGLGDGISYGGLGSRRGNVPKPNLSGCDITQKMEITVDIQVDRNGNVISATVGSATYQDKCIWDMVVEAAKRSKFSADEGSSYRQSGWIKYIIVP